MRSPANDVIMSTQPCRRSRIAGIAICVRCIGARRCISSMSRTRFSGNSSSGRRNVTAALFTRMSGAPTCAPTSDMSRSRSSLLEMSAWIAIAFPPAARIVSSVSLSDPTYFGSGSIVRAVSARVAPSAASRCATALPSPRLVPVTSATLPSHGPDTSRDTTHMPAQPLDVAQLRDRLAPLDADELAPLSGGASSLTFSARVGGARVVVKVAPPGLAPVLNRDVLRQARLLRALHGSAVPVPEVIWEDAGDPPDVPPLFVMSFVAGDSLEPLFDLDGGVPEAIVAERMRNAATTLGALHAIDPRAIGLVAEPIVGVGAEIDRWCRALAPVDPP